MALGDKLRQARQAAGLSQRQLCGDVITRNMLSQIENGAATPSMSTLQFLAGQLSLPISYFLDEEAAVSANSGCMHQAWAQFENGRPAESYHLLDEYRGPDPIYDREYQLLKSLVLLELARKNLILGRNVYVRQLLSELEALEPQLPWLPELREKRTEIAAAVDPIPEEALPSLDQSLFLHASAALRDGNSSRAVHLLDAIVDQSTPKWHLLRGKAAFAQQEYAAAANHLVQAEDVFSAEVVPMLELCFKELGDYKMAYHYACKSR